jgi:hypothetical protein
MGFKNIHFCGVSLAARDLWRLLTRNSLGKAILEEKYIKPGSIIHWIRNPGKNVKMFQIIGKLWFLHFQSLDNNYCGKLGMVNRSDWALMQS